MNIYSKHTFSWLENRRANKDASLPAHYLSDKVMLKATDAKQCESYSTSMHRDSLLTHRGGWEIIRYFEKSESF